MPISLSLFRPERILIYRFLCMPDGRLFLVGIYVEDGLAIRDPRLIRGLLASTS